MNVLLDTNAILFLTLTESQLPTAVTRLLDNSANSLLISPISPWEIAIKMCIGKLTLNVSFDRYWEQAIESYHFQFLPIELRHTQLLTSLPLHHRDPFDRMLVAQALVENLPIVSSDVALDAYGIQRIW